MSTFTVVVLAIVAYFIIGGFVMGLIDETACFGDVWFWPVHVLVWLSELMIDLAIGLKESMDTRSIAEVLEDCEE